MGFGEQTQGKDCGWLQGDSLRGWEWGNLQMIPMGKPGQPQKQSTVVEWRQRGGTTAASLPMRRPLPPWALRRAPGGVGVPAPPAAAATFLHLILSVVGAITTLTTATSVPPPCLGRLMGSGIGSRAGLCGWPENKPRGPWNEGQKRWNHSS